MITTGQPKSNRPLIEVHERDRETWQAALDRWTARLSQRDGAIFAFRPADIEEGICRSYDVASYSQPGTTHLVELFLVGTGVYAGCDCTAGEMSVICQHAAGAMDEAGWWPFEINRQLSYSEVMVDLPVAQAPPALYRLGQLVRYARIRRSVFTITAAAYRPERGWLYELQAMDGKRWSQPIAECYLSLHTNKRRRAA